MTAPRLLCYCVLAFGFIVLAGDAASGQAKKKGKAKAKVTRPAANLGARVPVRPFPPLGMSAVPPTGPWYYSFWDMVFDDVRFKPPHYPYSPISPMAKSFFDSDFRYLFDPKNRQFDVFDPLHTMQPGNWLVSTGGELRWRQMNEGNARLTGRDNDFDLFRVRVFADAWYKTWFRAYVEFLDAHSGGEELATLPIDENRADLLNAFIDLKLGEVGGGPVYLRAGRQELLFGSERLISPLDWANTRRTFQGVRAFHTSPKFDVDFFWVQPVVTDSAEFDSVDNDVQFAGLWTTYRPRKGHLLDNYYLWVDNVTPTAPAGFPKPPPFNVHTLGSRYYGKERNWLWDVEVMVQAGERGDQSIFAGAATAGGGYHFRGVPLNPTLWVYYDYASGTENPGQGDHYTTFNQLFPFGHYYMGWLDLVGRQNIRDANAHLYLYPANWVTVWLQYHHFELASARDALYNAAGAPVRRDPTGRAGTNVGDEFDLVVNFHLTAHSDLWLGYSKLFAGEFLRATGVRESPDLFWVQYSFRW